jgi:hypothetical protein
VQNERVLFWCARFLYLVAGPGRKTQRFCPPTTCNAGEGAICNLQARAAEASGGESMAAAADGVKSVSFRGNWRGSLHFLRAVSKLVFLLLRKGNAQRC